MTRDKTPWHQSDNPAKVGRGATGWLTLLAIWTVVVIAVVGAASLGVRWLTSDARGAAEADIRINSAENRIAAQEAAETLYGNILAHDRNLDQAARDKTEHPGDMFFATNYSGLVKVCNDAVTRYNADVRKVSREKWISTDLPYEIDGRDPRTDCKESTPR